MEGLTHQLHISFIGSRDNAGNSFTSLNFAYDMLSRNFRVIYTTSDEDRETRKFFSSIKPGKDKNSVTLSRTKTEKLSLMSFSQNFDSRYTGKIEEIFKSEEADIYIHNIINPLSPPYNILLTMSDIWIITTRIESAAISDYFSMIKKLMMLEKHPEFIYIIFNNTKEIERAFEIFRKLLKESDEFEMKLLPVFLGAIPNDPLRQAHAIRIGTPVRMLFEECPTSGAISFMGDKILYKFRNTNPQNLPAMRNESEYA